MQSAKQRRIQPVLQNGGCLGRGERRNIQQKSAFFFVDDIHKPAGRGAALNKSVKVHGAACRNDRESECFKLVCKIPRFLIKADGHVSPPSVGFFVCKHIIGKAGALYTCKNFAKKYLFCTKPVPFIPSAPVRGRNIFPKTLLL